MKEDIIKYCCKWPEIQYKTNIMDTFAKDLTNNSLKQILVPISLQESIMLEAVNLDERIKRIFSAILDTYETLPLRPDIAFDYAWRALEIAMSYYKKLFPNPSYTLDNMNVIMAQAGEDIFLPLLANESIKSLFSSLFDSVNLPIYRFAVIRLFVNNDSQVDSQQKSIDNRFKYVLGEDVFNEIKNKYIKVENTITPNDERKCALLLRKLFNGEKVNIDVIDRQLSDDKRVTLFMGSILYTCRCERFHGDYYSPLISSLAKDSFYRVYYTQLLWCYVLYWLTMYQIILKKEMKEIFNLDDFCSSVRQSLSNLDKVCPLDKKKDGRK